MTLDRVRRTRYSYLMTNTKHEANGIRVEKSGREYQVSRVTADGIWHIGTAKTLKAAMSTVRVYESQMTAGFVK